MAANLESAIYEKLKSLPPEKQEQVLDFVEGLANGAKHETVSQKLERHLRGVPAEELAELPALRKTSVTILMMYPGNES